MRCHYTNPHEARLAFESLKVFRNWAEVVGGDCGFEATGFLQVVRPAYEAQLRANVAAQQAIGINTRVLSASDVKALVPEARVDDLTVAAYEPDSGFADPNATLYGFIEAARRLGVEVRTGVEVTGIVVSGGRAAGVETSHGRIEAGAVVLAPGVWATRLLAPLGLDLALVPHRAQVAIFRWPAGFSHRHPVFIDKTVGAWFRPEGAAATLIGVEMGITGADIDGLDEGVDPDYVALCREKLATRLPAFAEATMRGGWAGASPVCRPRLYERGGAGPRRGRQHAPCR